MESFLNREADGCYEPPVTPIGRDELELKRHRLYSDLVHAAQAAVEHRVRFDPLGPNVEGDLVSTFIFAFIFTFVLNILLET